MPLSNPPRYTPFADALDIRLHLTGEEAALGTILATCSLLQTEHTTG
jgi:hypothetical protein